MGSTAIQAAWKRTSATALRASLVVWAHLVDRPAHFLVASFAVVILIGTLLLALPSSSVGAGLSAIDALFTATSATCVTGLIVVDTAKDLSLFGQGTVLLLIQIGGIGTMTISAFIALAVGSSIGLREEFALAQAVGEARTRTALRLVKFVVMATLAIEAAGALLLWPHFRAGGRSGAGALWHGVFHSVSAFCNAGFALYTDSLCGFADSAFTTAAVATLIVAGGLGFGVLICILDRATGRVRRLNFHTRIVLAMTLFLCVSGALVFFALERQGLFRDHSSGYALVHSAFQSITTRTAGFNTVDLTLLSPASKLVTMALMFIGAAPGSTAGGVKITTLAVMAAVILAVVRGRENVVLAGREIGAGTVLRAVALIALALTVLGCSSLLLFTTQPHLSPDTLFFEAVSALGTVGLSLGATPQLNAAGKLIVTLLMFIGRVGPLTLLVMMQPRRRLVVEHPSADLMIG